MAIPAGEKAPRIRVLVADSNQTKSELLCSALKRHAAFAVAWCKAAPETLLQEVRASRPDVILLGDANGSSASACEIIRDVRFDCPEAVIVRLVDSYDRELVISCLRAGARGIFCQANQSFKSLLRCIQAVHQGQFWTNTEQMTYIVEALTDTPPIKITDAKGEVLLTARENQVVSLVAEGLGNRAIAKRLAVTENTVKKSLLHIFDKLGISNRVELVLYAMSRTQAPEPAPAISHPTPTPARHPSRKKDEVQIRPLRQSNLPVLAATGAA
jgi:DNA-binding NarL/FixJ family response regulator